MAETACWDVAIVLKMFSDKKEGMMTFLKNVAVLFILWIAGCKCKMLVKLNAV